MGTQTYSVIMAGGQGTRFWPLSRAQRPKQLLRMMSRKSLLRETFDRVAPLSGRERTLVVTVAEQLRAARGHLANLPLRNFLSEPYGNNTAPCIGLAALEIVSRHPQAVMLVLPADHWVANVAAFRVKLKKAVDLALRRNDLVTLGVRPDYPETGYGYIVKGRRLEEVPAGSAYHVKKFKEKPTLAGARALIREGSLWNSGIFVWRASTLLELMQRYQPTVFSALEHIRTVAGGRSLATPTPAIRSAVVRAYARMPSISIDHGVLENAAADGRVITLEASFAWSDIGSWAAVHRMMQRDKDGNAGLGKWLALDSKNCLAHSGDRLVVLLGVQDLFVVDTADALLVGNLKCSQQVRELVTELKKSGYREYTIK